MFKKMFRRVKVFLYNNKYTICLFLALLLRTGDAYAVFEGLTEAGKKIVAGLHQVIYPAATIGISCVCIGGMFGNFNWKWLIAILLGVFIIGYAGDEQSSVASLAGAD